MKTYELTYIITPEAGLEGAEAKAKEFEALVQKEGVIIKHLNPIARTLPYPIKKHSSGFFGVLEFQTEPEKIDEIKKELVKDGKISRFMVTIKEASKVRKERKGRIKTPAPVVETHVEKPSDPLPKVELKDIEQKLEELLG
jgi:ribosomal protein S6